MNTRLFSILICCLVVLSSCEKDGDFLRVFGLGSPELMSSETGVVLTKDNSSTQVLALTWDKSELSISDTSKGLPGSIPVETIEVSATSDFATFISISAQSNTYSFLGAALNTLGKNLGFTAGVSSPMYVRINSALGVNTEPHYSNVVSVDITCYSIDMSRGLILDSKKEDTGFKLFSPESDGEYYGFTGDGAWYNWYLLEGDGTLWGNLALDGNAFALSSDAAAQWNFWYPGQSGCYYTTLSTTSQEWTATWIPSLTVSGAVDASMTFDKATVKWMVSFTTTGANQTVKVKGTDAKLYNRSTSTDDGAAIARTIGFIPTGDSSLTFDWNSESATDFTIPEAGEYTLIFSLADPENWSYRIQAGSVVVVDPISKFLYLPGIDDNISGSWTFDNYLNLVSEDDSTFAGAVLVDSKWGYQMGLTSGDWVNVYQKGATDGTLAFKSGTNIPAPGAGLYLIEADLKNLTYSHTAITSLSYAGLNDNWTMAAMDATAVAGVYSSTVTINSVSPWGCKLYLNGSWDYFFGGAEGVLAYKGPGIVDDATIGLGTYDFIADVRNASYVFLGNEVYIGGLNDVWDFTSVVLTKSATGVYTGTATITAASSYGIKIYLDQTWNRFFGGSFSHMSYLGANITDDQALAAGTYNVTVDFIHGTCAFAAK
jgi:hypothetical protein